MSSILCLTETCTTTLFIFLVVFKTWHEWKFTTLEHKTTRLHVPFSPLTHSKKSVRQSGCDVILVWCSFPLQSIFILVSPEVYVEKNLKRFILGQVSIWRETTSTLKRKFLVWLENCPNAQVWTVKSTHGGRDRSCVTRWCLAQVKHREI